MAKDEKLLAAVMDAAKAIDDKFGLDIKILDISGLTLMGDYFLIATANNPNQMRAICHAADEALEKNKIKLLHSEGAGGEGGWVLMDFGSVIVHIFDKDQRDYYNLERLWSDAEQIEPNFSA